MPSMPVGEVKVKVVPDMTDFMKQVAAVRDQAESEILAMRLRTADPLACRLRELPNSALRNNVIAIADGDEFWLHSWTLNTRDGEDSMLVVWRRPSDLVFMGRLSRRTRFAMWLRRISTR